MSPVATTRNSFLRPSQPSNEDDLISLICTHTHTQRGGGVGVAQELHTSKVGAGTDGQDFGHFCRLPCHLAVPLLPNTFHPQKCSLNFCNLLSCCEDCGYYECAGGGGGGCGCGLRGRRPGIRHLSNGFNISYQASAPVCGLFNASQ